MKLLFAAIAMIAVATSKLTDALQKKYSIEILNEGQPGTEPTVGDEV